MRVGSFYASIQVGGKSLEELDVKVEGSTATCYVEAQSDQNFGLYWTEDSHYPHGDTEGRVFVDGSRKSLFCARLHGNKQSSFRESVNIGPGQARLLSFGSITTTEDEDLSVASTSSCDSLGTITVKFYRGTRGKPKGRSKGFVDLAAAIAGTVHNEVQAKKSKASFVATLGAAVTRNSVSVSFDATDPPNAPFITFKFIYRSHSILQALGLIAPDSPIQRPRSLSPIAGPSRPRAARQQPQEIIDISSDDDDLPDTPEVKAAKEQLRLAQQKATQERSRGKRASTAADLDVKPDIKPDVKRPKLEDQGVIDLTED